MDQIFSMGKSLFGGGSNDDEGSSGGLDFSNPFAMLFQLDRDGDGKITEEGNFLVIEFFGILK